MKLFLAGTSASSYMQTDILKSLYILESYFYFQKWQIPLIYSSKDFLLDSGAFTFMSSKAKNRSNFKEYLKGYIDFINKYDIKRFFELDIDVVVGLNKVEEYRRILEAETGKKSIPVWHVSRGKDYWIKMCQEYEYIAYGGILTDGVERKVLVKYMPWFLSTAKKYNCKVHLLGFTPSNIEKFNAYSCDSTSWKCGEKFGFMYSFNGKLINVVRKDNKRICDRKNLTRHNFNQWVYFQKYLDRY